MSGGEAIDTLQSTGTRRKTASESRGGSSFADISRYWLTVPD